MRIKKKHVLKESLILEGLLIDDLNMDPFDKKVIKSLHRRFKDVSMWNINSYEIIDELHDTLNIPLERAFKIVNTYIYKRDYLFKEHDYIKNIEIKDIFNTYGRKFFRKFKETLDNESLIKDNYFWNLKIGNRQLPYEAYFWDSFNGYTLYLPVDWNLRARNVISTIDIYTILINVDFNWENSTVDIKYRIGKDDNESRGIITDNLPFEYPEGEITNQKGLEWVKNNLYNVVKPLVLDFQFPSVKDDVTDI